MAEAFNAFLFHMTTNSTPHGTETRRNSKRRDFIPILDKCQFKTCNNFQITSQKFPDDFWGLAILLLIRTWGSFPGGKLSLTSTDAINALSYAFRAQC